ncbi:quinon protein alcohol dehydrogenase-like superfamily [Suillus bovinus]|uniref:quinon protein alcohol dehydrogenase-like superfamily n=1 Tax=Suillus bovinus TaxID=48563 RepID=UPI001B878724|nr:quinon protein alcohol dehydrogenase-like superfamily [Suillus bovinus]KAG2151669.1 quinon protein alcohol dehydrogenase-like superfamily [Suillus bovinus]
MPRQTMQDRRNWVNGVVHLPGGQHIVACSPDGSLRLWDRESGAQIGGAWWDRNNAVSEGCYSAVRCIALSPNGKTIASGSEDGKVRLWEVETRKLIATWTGVAGNMLLALCWRADGKRVVTGSASWDGTARVWDVDSGRTVLTINTGREWVRAVIYSPDSSKLATGGDSYRNASWRDSAVNVWDAKTGKLLQELEPYYGSVFSLAWTSDGKKLISGSDCLITIFDTATWQAIARLQGHTDFVTAISLSQNDRLLASASLDKTACLWDLDTKHQVIPSLPHGRDLRSAALSPDGKVLVTGCEDAKVHVWDVYAIATAQYLLEQKAAYQDDSGSQHTTRLSLNDKSFLEADATRCLDQFGDVDELSPTFFDGMEADAHFSPMGGACPHSSANSFFLSPSSFIRRFWAKNDEATELPQPSSPSLFYQAPRAFFAHLSSFIHRSPSENHAPDELQQPSTPSQLDPHVLLDRLDSFLPRPRLGTDREAEPRPTTHFSSRSDALFSQLSSLFRSRPHTNEEIELPRRPNCPRVVEVAAVRDKQTLVVARGPNFMKSKRAYDEQQSKLHDQAQPSSSHTQPTNTSQSATLPASGANTTTVGTTATRSLAIRLWTEVVLFLCCASQSHANSYQCS